MRSIHKIIIHHTATTKDMDIGAEEIRRWHVHERGWRDVGYHYIIRRDGSLEYGRPVEQSGAHAIGHNQDSIGVALVGGSPDVNFTRKQWLSLKELISELSAKYPQAEIVGHRDVGSTHCPGFDVAAWWNGDGDA